MTDARQTKPVAARGKSHMPETLFYEKIVPALLILLGLVMLGLIVVGFAVIFGYVRF